MNKILWIAAMGLLSGCSELTTFTPGHECGEDGVTTQDERGEYYICLNEQWVSLSGVPQCEYKATKFEETDKVCMQYECKITDNELKWGISDKNDSTEQEKVSCKIEDGEVQPGDCLNDTIQCGCLNDLCDDSHQMSVCVAGKFLRVPKSLAICN